MLVLVIKTVSTWMNPHDNTVVLTESLLRRTRRQMDVPPGRGVVEAAPVPDLLGSILSGQSMLLMDSSDVVINRDGSLKATKSSKLVRHIFKVKMLKFDHVL